MQPKLDRPSTLRRDLVLAAIILALFLFGMGALAAATGWEETWTYLTRLSFAQVMLLLFLSQWNYTLRGARWHFFTRVLRIGSGFWQDLRHYIAGFAMTVTPGRVGELIRLRWIYLETGAPVERTGPLVLVDRASDMATMGVMLAFTVLAGTAGLAGGMLVAVLAVAAAAVVTRPELLHLAATLAWKTVGRWPRLFAKVRRASHMLKPFSRPAVFVPAMILGGLGWFAEGLSFYLLLKWMGAELPLMTAVGIFLLAMMTGGATGMPGGLGGAEAAMVALLSLQGIPLEISIPATAIIRLTTLWFAILLGLVVLPFAERMARKARHDLEN